MAAIVNFLTPANGPLIIEEISVGGDNTLDVLEIFSEWKDWLLADAGERLGYPQAFTVIGGEPKTATLDLGQAFFLHPEWKIRPAELDHRLTLVGDLNVLGGEGSVVTPTVGAYTVLVENQTSALITGLSTAVPSEMVTQVAKLAALEGIGEQLEVDGDAKTRKAGTVIEQSWEQVGNVYTIDEDA